MTTKVEASQKEAFSALLAYHNTTSGYTGGDIVDCGRRINLSPDQSHAMFEEICADLGEVPYLTGT